MDWTHVMAELDAHLSDDKVRRDVEAFLESVGHRLELDDEEVRFPLGTQVHVEERMLVRNSQVRGGGLFMVKAVLDPILQDGKPTGGSRSGTLKIMYDLEGRWLDEFYSRPL
ncbi:hypothetical protein [Corallococcus aberystwythensis]|uniref:Uncharacterized protein n=1 Tax=Corallococcus aberystwythensis TaxID=2316722 RepID=A0A3A8R7I9_9BACT|nr:hypothetical protein [Corallococcus aberystwythensis]RKH73232.1 hypothetical protein D7W81_04400 [Corallococcus aberystwythensis]